MKAPWFLALLAAVCLAVPARADLIISQPLHPTSPGTYSNLFSSSPSAQQVADHFTLSAPTSLDTLSWQGRYETSVTLDNPVTFVVRLFADDGGSPSKPLATPTFFADVTVNAVATGGSYDNFPWYTYSTTFTGLTLGPGKFWVSILEADGRTTNQWLWGNTAVRSQPAVSRSGDADVWDATGSSMAFQLTGTSTNPVPAPSGITLTLSALLALGAWRARPWRHT